MLQMLSQWGMDDGTLRIFFIFYCTSRNTSFGSPCTWRGVFEHRFAVDGVSGCLHGFPGVPGMIGSVR